MTIRQLKKHLDGIKALYQIDEIRHINAKGGTNYTINDYVRALSKSALKRYFSHCPLSHMLQWDSTVRREFIKWSICNDHNAKMEGLASMSTACTCNSNCKAYAQIDGSICAKCYAQNQLDYQPTTRNKYEQCYKFYTNIDLTIDDIPRINRRWFRFEAFGDIENLRQVRNYNLIALLNGHCDFVLWSKNPHILKEYYDYNSKPNNISIIVSSLFVNKPITLEQLNRTGYDEFVDAVFTVYSKEYAQEHGITINCGSRDCINCLRCYTLRYEERSYIGTHSIAFINELLKGDR